MDRPSLSQVALVAIAIAKKNNDRFKPSQIRVGLERHYPNSESQMLSSQIQPHLALLRAHGIVSIIISGQRRNRPYIVNDYARLQPLADNKDSFLSYYPSADLDIENPVDAEVNEAKGDELMTRIEDLEEKVRRLEGFVESILEAFAKIEY